VTTRRMPASGLRRTILVSDDSGAFIGGFRSPAGL
jgi:hypothetical protein